MRWREFRLRGTPVLFLLHESMSSTAHRLLLLAAVLLLVGLRLVHLEADTPHFVGTGSMGVFVDEGYKTLSARNQVLYGELHWHPEDHYAGWHRQSPVVHYATVAAFHLFGVGPGSARLVSLFSFTLLLLAFCWAYRGARATGFVVSGLLLLGLGHTLFFFSRLALLEIHLALALYGLLFLLRRRGNFSPGQTLLLVVLFSAGATFGIKRYAFLYFLPLLLAVLPQWLIAGRRFAGRAHGGLRLLTLFLLFSVPAAWAFLHRDLFADRVRLPPWWQAPREVILNPLTHSSALAVAAGLTAAVFTLLYRHRDLALRPYRGGLLALCLLGPLLFLPFPYDPLRYYVPLLPAYLLLALDWLDPRAPTERPLPTPPLAIRLLVVLLLGWVLLCLAQAVDKLILLPFDLRGEASRAFFLFPLITPLALLAAGLAWHHRRRLLTLENGRRVVLLLLALTLLRDALLLGRFLASPSYRSREIAEAIAQRTSKDATLAGDWAPFLTLGINRRALYLADGQNEPECVGRLRPDYFLWSDTAGGRRARSFLLGRPDALRLGPPTLSWSYAQREVILYPVEYLDFEALLPLCPAASDARRGAQLPVP